MCKRIDGETINSHYVMRYVSPAMDPRTRPPVTEYLWEYETDGPLANHFVFYGTCNGGGRKCFMYTRPQNLGTMGMHHWTMNEDGTAQPKTKTMKAWCEWMHNPHLSNRPDDVLDD